MAVSDGGKTYATVAREWFDLQNTRWPDHHAADVLTSFQKDLFPQVGSMPIRSISSPSVLAVLRLIEKRPAIELARRVRQRMSAVFVYAISSWRADTDPAAVVLGAMAPLKNGRQPAVTDLDAARIVIDRVEVEAAHPATKLTHCLLAITAVRPGTLITTPWSEFQTMNSMDPVWQIPAIRMKLKKSQKDDEARDHLVPLSKQALGLSPHSAHSLAPARWFFQTLGMPINR